MVAVCAWEHDLWGEDADPDWMTTRTQCYAARGEPYAEAYAMRVCDELKGAWPL